MCTIIVLEYLYFLLFQNPELYMFYNLVFLLTLNRVQQYVSYGKYMYSTVHNQSWATRHLSRPTRQRVGVQQHFQLEKVPALLCAPSATWQPRSLARWFGKLARHPAQYITMFLSSKSFSFYCTNKLNL